MSMIIDEGPGGPPSLFSAVPSSQVAASYFNQQPSAASLPHESRAYSLSRSHKPPRAASGSPAATGGPRVVPIGDATAPVPRPTTSAAWFDLGFSIPSGGRAFIAGAAADGGVAQPVSERDCYIAAVRADPSNHRAWFALGCELQAAEEDMVASDAEPGADGADGGVRFDSRADWFVSATIAADEGANAAVVVFADDCYCRAITAVNYMPPKGAAPPHPTPEQEHLAAAYGALSLYLRHHNRIALVTDRGTPKKLDGMDALSRAVACDATHGPVAYGLALIIAAQPGAPEGVTYNGRPYRGKDCFAAAIAWPPIAADPEAWVSAAQYLAAQQPGEYPPAIRVGDAFLNRFQCLARAATLLEARIATATDAAAASSSPAPSTTPHNKRRLGDILHALGADMAPDRTLAISGDELTKVQVLERAATVRGGDNPDTWIALAASLIDPAARATVAGIEYSTAGCYAKAVACVADDGANVAAADGDDGAESAQKPAATRERRVLQARAMRCVALAVPAGANVIVDGAPLTDVDLAVRALELDPLSCEGWFALGVALKTFAAARRSFAPPCTNDDAAAVPTTAVDHRVTVGGASFNAFEALVKASQLAPTVGDAVNCYMHLVELIPPRAAVRVGRLRATKVGLAAGVVAHASGTAAAWRTLGTALVAERDASAVAASSDAPCTTCAGAGPTVSVLMSEVDAKTAFIKALVCSGGASPLAWAGLLEATAEEPVVISPEQHFTRRECALNALRRSSMVGAPAWWAMATVLRANAGSYDSNTTTLAEIKGTAAASEADQEPMFELQCVTQCIRHGGLGDGAVVAKAVSRLLEMMSAGECDEEVSLTFRKPAVAIHDGSVPLDDAWQSSAAFGEDALRALLQRVKQHELA